MPKAWRRAIRTAAAAVVRVAAPLAALAALGCALQPPADPATAPLPVPRSESHRFAFVRVGLVDRAPMAFFAHDGHLVVSGISRNQIRETSVWSVAPGGKPEKASLLPEWCESGAAGYSAEGTIHLAPESWSGMVVYTSNGPAGPWTKQDFTHLNPHEFKDLKWGFATRDPDTGHQYLGFGNADHAGVVLIRDREWRLFAATPDMRFPTAVSDITMGLNAGSTLISTSTYGQCRLHLARPDGGVQTILEQDTWGFARVDNADGLAYLALEDGRVLWSTVSDLLNWRECLYHKPAGRAERIEILGEPLRHPRTGAMLFPTRDSQKGAIGIYQPRLADGEVVLEQVAWQEGAGDWAVKLAEVDGQVFVGSGLRTGYPEDLTPGVIYRLELEPMTAGAPTEVGPVRPWIIKWLPCCR